MTCNHGAPVCSGCCSARAPGPSARRVRAQWQQHLTRLLAVIEPTLIVAVGLFVLLVALAVLIPILSLNKAFT